MCRRIYHDEWRADDSSFRQVGELGIGQAHEYLRVYPFDLEHGAGTLCEILQQEGLRG